MKYSDFPQEIKDKVKERVEEQSNVYTQETETLLNGNISSDKSQGSFDWTETPEKHKFWSKVLTEKDFDLFFTKYPKDHSLDAFQASVDPCDPCSSDYFEIGDEVEVIYKKPGHWHDLKIGTKFVIEDFGFGKSGESFNNNSNSAHFNNNVFGVNWTKDMLRIVRKGNQLDNSNNKIYIQHGKSNHTSSPIIFGFSIELQGGDPIRGETITSTESQIKMGS
jgi:hypothetical protein